METLEINADEDETGCWGYDEQDCKYYFGYLFNMTTHKLQVKVQKARECPPQVYVLGIVLGVIAAVVLVGLALLLVWKIATSIHDRREFARFEKERMMARWDAVSLCHIIIYYMSISQKFWYSRFLLADSCNSYQHSYKKIHLPQFSAFTQY